MPVCYIPLQPSPRLVRNDGLRGCQRFYTEQLAGHARIQAPTTHRDERDSVIAAFSHAHLPWLPVWTVGLALSAASLRYGHKLHSRTFHRRFYRCCFLSDTARITRRWISERNKPKLSPTLVKSPIWNRFMCVVWVVKARGENASCNSSAFYRDPE